MFSKMEIHIGGKLTLTITTLMLLFCIASTVYAGEMTSESELLMYKNFSDVEIANLAESALFGKLNNVSKIYRDGNASGSFTPSFQTSVKLFDERVDNLLIKSYGAKNRSDLWKKVIPEIYCFEKEKYNGRDDSAAKAHCAKSEPMRVYKDWGDPIMGLIILDGILKFQPEKIATNVRHNYIASFGHKRVRYKYSSGDFDGKGKKVTLFGVKVKKVSIAKWRYSDLRYSLNYAVKNKFAPKLISILSKVFLRKKKYRQELIKNRKWDKVSISKIKEEEIALEAERMGWLFEQFSDKEIKDIAIKNFMGTLNKVKSLMINGKRPKIARGEFTISYAKSYNVFERRLEKILTSSFKAESSYDLWGRVLPLKYCLEKKKYDKSKVNCKKENPGKLYLKWSDKLLSAIILESLLIGSTVDYAKSVREVFLKSIGRKRIPYIYNSIDPLKVNILNRMEIHGVVVKETDIDEWNFKNVRYAISYGKTYSLDKSFRTALSKALISAPKYRCRVLSGVYFTSIYKGGGKYGPKEASHWSLYSGEEISCKEVLKVKSTRWAVKLVEKLEYDIVNRWLAAETAKKWDVLRDDFGRIIKKRVEGTIYWREEL